MAKEMKQIKKRTLESIDCHLTTMTILIGLCCLASFIVGILFIIEAMDTNNVSKLVFGIIIWIVCVAFGYWTYNLGEIEGIVAKAKANDKNN